MSVKCSVPCRDDGADGPADAAVRPAPPITAKATKMVRSLAEARGMADPSAVETYRHQARGCPHSGYEPTRRYRGLTGKACAGAARVSRRGAAAGREPGLTGWPLVIWHLAPIAG